MTTKGAQSSGTDPQSMFGGAKSGEQMLRPCSRALKYRLPNQTIPVAPRRSERPRRPARLCPRSAASSVRDGRTATHVVGSQTRALASPTARCGLHDAARCAIHPTMRLLRGRTGRPSSMVSCRLISLRHPQRLPPGIAED
jgi:hypothetical protein